MINRAVSERYALVLFNIDRTQDKLESRLSDFELILHFMRENPKLVKFLNAPQIPTMEKKEMIQNSFKGVFDSTFISFLVYLIRKGRLSYLEQIEDEYGHHINKYFRIWEVDVITAVPLDQLTEAKLKQKLVKDVQKRIVLNKKIDPSIVGGMILVIANDMLDGSISGRLNKLRESLMEEVT